MTGKNLLLDQPLNFLDNVKMCYGTIDNFYDEIHLKYADRQHVTERRIDEATKIIDEQLESIKEEFLIFGCHDADEILLAIRTDAEILVGKKEFITDKTDLRK